MSEERDIVTYAGFYRPILAPVQRCIEDTWGWGNGVGIKMSFPKMFITIKREVMG